MPMDFQVVLWMAYVVCIIPRSVSGRWTSTWQYSLIEEEQPGKVVAVDFTQDGNMSVA